MIEQNGWNIRDVDFRKVHGDDGEAFASLFGDLNIFSGMRIGDFMGGYGEISQRVLKCAQDRNASLDVLLLDAFQSQIDKSYSFLKPYESSDRRVEREIQDIRNLSVEPESLDAVVIKMGLHELSRGDQVKALSEAYRSLKSGSSLYLWFSTSGFPECAQSYRDVVRKKDELAGYFQMVQNRYFASENEIVGFLKEAGFSDSRKIYSGFMNCNTRKFCDADMKGDMGKLREFNEYLRRLPEHVKQDLKFVDEGESISFHPRKLIIKATKS